MTTTPDTALATTVGRAAGYELLARCFAYPDTTALEGMREAASAMGHLLAGGPLHELLEALAIAVQPDLEDAYSGCFTLTTSADCPTYETAYLCTDSAQETARLADISGFYQAWGVDAAGTEFRPDDICVELEFVAYLCRKEAHALEHLGAPRVGQVRRAQRLFLGEHLGRWAGALASGAAHKAPMSPFYTALGGALRDWVRDDAGFLDVTMDAVSGGPRLPWPDRLERGGPMGGQAALIDPDEIVLAR